MALIRVGEGVAVSGADVLAHMPLEVAHRDEVAGEFVAEFHVQDRFHLDDDVDQFEGIDVQIGLEILIGRDFKGIRKFRDLLQDFGNATVDDIARHVSPIFNETLDGDGH